MCGMRCNARSAASEQETCQYLVNILRIYVKTLLRFLSHLPLVGCEVSLQDALQHVLASPAMPVYFVERHDSVHEGAVAGFGITPSRAKS